MDPLTPFTALRTIAFSRQFCPPAFFASQIHGGVHEVPGDVRERTGGCASVSRWLRPSVVAWGDWVGGPQQPASPLRAPAGVHRFKVLPEGGGAAAASSDFRPAQTQQPPLVSPISPDNPTLFFAGPSRKLWTHGRFPMVKSGGLRAFRGFLCCQMLL